MDAAFLLLSTKIVSAKCQAVVAMRDLIANSRKYADRQCGYVKDRISARCIVVHVGAHMLLVAYVVYMAPFDTMWSRAKVYWRRMKYMAVSIQSTLHEIVSL